MNFGCMKPKKVITKASPLASGEQTLPESAITELKSND